MVSMDTRGSGVLPDERERLKFGVGDLSGVGDVWSWFKVGDVLCKEGDFARWDSEVVDFTVTEDFLVSVLEFLTSD